MFDILLKNFIPRFREHLILKQRSEETIRGYVNDITQLDRFLFAKYNSQVTIEKITSDDIEDYLLMLQTEKNYAVAS